MLQLDGNDFVTGGMGTFDILLQQANALVSQGLHILTDGGKLGNHVLTNGKAVEAHY